MISDHLVKRVLTPAGRNIEAVGRKLKSPKNDIQELRDLQATLRLTADMLDSVIEVIKMEQQ